MIEEVRKKSQARMEKALEALKREFASVRTGRASTHLLDGIHVSYYGTETPLSQVASLSVPEPRMIVIQPWQASLIPDIEKAIQKSELGLTPSNDGKVVRLAVPPLTEERRKELAKVVKKMAEDTVAKIKSGEFHPFTGPITKQDGTTVGEAGKSLPDGHGGTDTDLDAEDRRRADVLDERAEPQQPQPQQDDSHQQR